TTADSDAERDFAVEMLTRLPASQPRRTVAGDKGYDGSDFVAKTRQRAFTPHVALNTTNRRSASTRPIPPVRCVVTWPSSTSATFGAPTGPWTPAGAGWTPGWPPRTPR